MSADAEMCVLNECATNVKVNSLDSKLKILNNDDNNLNQRSLFRSKRVL